MSSQKRFTFTSARYLEALPSKLTLNYIHSFKSSLTTLQIHMRCIFTISSTTYVHRHTDTRIHTHYGQCQENLFVVPLWGNEALLLLVTPNPMIKLYVVPAILWEIEEIISYYNHSLLWVNLVLSSISLILHKTLKTSAQFLLVHQILSEQKQLPWAIYLSRFLNFTCKWPDSSHYFWSFSKDVFYILTSIFSFLQKKWVQTA